MDVLMPDGTTITGVPEGITQSDLLARYNKFSTMQPAAKPARPAFEPTLSPEEQVMGAVGAPGEQVPAGAPGIKKPPSELAIGEELGKGVGAGAIGLQSMWENAGVMKDVGVLKTVKDRLDLFNKIETGQITSPDQLRGLDQTTSQARAYFAADPATREKMRARNEGEIGRRTDFVKASIDTLAQYQKDAEKYKGRTTDLTDVEGAKDFANWLSYNMGSGAVQMAPIMLAAATTGPAGVAVLGAGMGTSEAIGNRLEFLQDKIKDLPPDQKAQAVIDYVQKTGDTSLAVGIISGAMDSVLGPAATLAKRGLGEVVKGETRKQALKAGVKELPKQMGEEFLTGGAQEATQIAGAVREKEQEKFLTEENLKKILNAAAAEAAGAVGGGGASTAARVYGAKGAPTAEQGTTALAQTPAAEAEAPVAPVVPSTPIAPEVVPASASQDTDAMMQELLGADLTGVKEEPTPSLQATEEVAAEEKPAEAPVAEAPAEEPKELTLKEQYDKAAKLNFMAGDAFRNRLIDQDQLDKIRSDYDRIKAEYQASIPKGELNPIQQEATDIADKLEALGLKPFADGMRTSIEKNQVGEQNLEFYRTKLKQEQAKAPKAEAGVERPSEKWDWADFYSDDTKGQEKLKLFNSKAKPEVKQALQTLSDSIQAVTNRLNDEGYTMYGPADLNAPKEIKDLRNQIQLRSAEGSLLINKFEALNKGFNRSKKTTNQENLDKAIADVKAGAAEAQKSLQRSVPEPEEVAGARAAVAEANKRVQTLEYKSGSLWSALMGKLDPEEVREIFGPNPSLGEKKLQVTKKSGKRGSYLVDMVASGGLDAYLPIDMRHDSGRFNEAESAQYIKDAVANKDYLPHDVKEEIENIYRGVEPLGDLIDEYLTIEEQNRELQIAADEQREADQAAEVVEPEGENRPAEPSERPARELELATQTADELKAKQDEIDRLEKENKRLTKEAEAKAKADEQAKEFVLTGSEREADQAAARGQKDIFAETPTEPPELQPALGTIEELVQTPAFEKWFGDSKVVDADGKPLVVYHGTVVRPDTEAVKGMGDIMAFDRMFTTQFRAPSIDTVGSFFSTNPGEGGAQMYSGTGEGAAIYPVYLSIKNPYTTTFETMLRRARMLENGVDDGRKIGAKEVEALRKFLKESGKDGIHIKADPKIAEFKDQDVWIALEPEQIKSATGNRGAFNESPNIAFSLGNIENLAKQYNGKIVFGDDDLGLVLAYGERTGEPLYVPYVKDAMFRNDIEQFPAKSFKLSDADYQKLVDAKRNLEQAAIEKHEKTPFLKMGEGVTGSKGIPGNVLSVTKGWAKMLNLTGNIHVMTDEEALRDKDKFTGPHRAIGYIGFLGEPGMVKKTGPDEYIVVVRKSTSTGKTLEILAHELGHIHEGQAFEKADTETKNAVIKEFNQWFNKSKAGTAGELIESMRAKRMARATKGDMDIPALEMQNRQYWLGFKEWYADQVSRWATTNAKPVGVVEQFFSRLGKAIRSFFSKAQAAKYLPNETFAEYLEKVSAVTDLTKPNDVFTGDQIPLFASEDIGGRVPPNTPRRNYEGNPAPEAAFESPEESKMDTLIYKLQDKLIDTKRVMEAIEKTSGEIAENWNVYQKEETYHGRLSKRTEDFLDDELMPIFKEMKQKGVSLDDLETYLHNRHAEEANKYIAKINPERPDGGSGIKTEDAKAYLESLTPEQRANYDSLASKIDKIIKGTQKILVDNGLDKKEVIDNWNKAYKHYVPLERDNLDFVQSGRGVMGGFSTRGGASKRRVGSEKDVINIFANIALQRERALRRSEQVRVGRALYGMTIKYPNPDFWLPINPDAIKDKEKLIAELKALGLSDDDAENIIQEPKEPQFDKKTGLVRYQVNPLLRNSPNVFPVRVDGEDRFIIFNPNDPRAKRMVESLKNLDAEQLGAVLGTVGMATRWIASVNTQYNPVFGAWNFARDVQGAALNLSTTELAGKEKEVLKSTWPALFAVYRDLRGKEGKTKESKAWIDMFERFQLAGGQTGYQNQFSETKKKANVVERELAKLDHGTARKAAESVFKWLSDYNDAMENSVRLAAFKVAVTPKEEGGLGMSDDAAASLAKNLTVNFNRKGASSPILQSLYAFFNAAVQGNARLIKTLRGPAGKKIIAGGMAIGAFQAIALAMAGFDDDEPPDFVKDKNIVIPIGDGKYLTIPMPLGFNVFPGLGRLAMEAMLIGTGDIKSRKGAASKFASAASLIVDSFNPLGSGSVQQMLTPTVADPLMALYANRDAFGRPISKEDRATAPTPGYERSRENASVFSQKLAEAMNWLTSPAGTKHTKGWASPTADQIDYFIGQYTGGVGREIMKAGETAKSFVTKEEQPIYRVPILGKLYGETGTPAAISSKFYGNVTAMAEHEHEIKQRQKARESISDYYAENPEARLWQRANYIENQISRLNKEKKALRERGATDEQIKRKEDQKIQLMKAFNDQVSKAQ